MRKNIIKIIICVIVLFFTFSSFAEAIVPGNTTSKKGVGNSGASMDQLNGLGASWGYSWGLKSFLFDNLSNYTYVPMVWGVVDSNNTVEINQIAAAHPGIFWLIWNEPDRSDQANISAEQAAQLYCNVRKKIKMADPAAKLIVGGVANLNISWLQTFRETYKSQVVCTGLGETGNVFPTVEGWHVHYYIGIHETYNSANWRSALTGFKNWMTSNGGIKDTWLTEFGCLDCWTPVGTALMKQLMLDQVPWLESQTWIKRYAWFATISSPSMTGDLVSGAGLSDLGQYYAAFGNSPTPTPTPMSIVAPPTLSPPVCNCNGSQLTGISLNWLDNSSNEDGFKIMRRNFPIGTTNPWKVKYTLQSNITSWIDQDVVNGSTYRYKVRSFVGNPTETSGSDSSIRDITCNCTNQASSLTFSFRSSGISVAGITKLFEITFSVDGTLTSFEFISTSGENGIFSVNQLLLTGISQGTYTVFIKDKTGNGFVSNHLRKSFGELTIVIGQNTAPVDWGTNSNYFLKPGDVNGDNKITIEDVTAILSVYTAISVPVDISNKIYDINNDSVLNIGDVSLVLGQYIQLTVSGD